MKNQDSSICELTKENLSCLNGLNDCRTPRPPILNMDQYLEFMYENLCFTSQNNLHSQRKMITAKKSQMTPFCFKN